MVYLFCYQNIYACIQDTLVGLVKMKAKIVYIEKDKAKKINEILAAEKEFKESKKKKKS